MTKWLWLDERDAIALHDRSLVLHGGAPGLRDQGLLQSALARPQQLSANGEDVDIIFLAASYTEGVVHNQPFVDGNKRTGFILGVLFIEINGGRFEASEEDAATAVWALASGELDEAGYAMFLRANVKHE